MLAKLKSRITLLRVIHSSNGKCMVDDDYLSWSSAQRLRSGEPPRRRACSQSGRFVFQHQGRSAAKFDTSTEYRINIHLRASFREYVMPLLTI